MDPLTQLELFKKAIDDLSDEGMELYPLLRSIRMVCAECGMIPARDYNEVLSVYQPMPCGVMRKVAGILLCDGYFYVIYPEYQDSAEIVSLDQLN